MNFRQFAFNNVIRNKRLYAAYFLSSMFTVLVFFTFALFAFHPTLNNGDSSSSAMTAMSVSGGIIYVFSFFFILYSMSSFLQSRKKEFGLLMMQGMSFRQLRLMVFLENMVIGLFATLSGIVFGLVFAKVILLIAENALVIEGRLDFYVPWLALGVTFVSFTILFLIISFFVAFVLRTRKVIDLIKSDRKSKGEPKASLLLSIIAAILLVLGYGIALYVKGLAVVTALLPVVLLVTLGTYFLFTQISVYVIRRLKRNESVFWKKTNMIQFSDLAFRMKDNARSFFMVAMISTVAFSAIGGLFGTQTYLTEGIEEANPFSVSYEVNADAPEVKAEVRSVEKVLKEHRIETDKERVILKHIPNKEVANVVVMKVSDYNKTAKLLGKEGMKLGKGEAVVAKESVASIMGDDFADRLVKLPIKLQDGKSVIAKEVIIPKAFQYDQAYYIVSDEIQDHLSKVVSSEEYYLWQVTKGSKSDRIDAGEALRELDLIHNIVPIDYLIYTVNKVYGPILFIGLFIGLVFFVSAGSFLYFRLYTDLDEDKRKFRAIAKIGLTDKELKKIINRQTAILFFTPLIVSLTHGAVALTALSRMLNYNLVIESTIVLASFFVIQVIYFMVVRYLYLKQIRKAI